MSEKGAGWCFIQYLSTRLNEWKDIRFSSSKQIKRSQFSLYDIRVVD
jgi:hypothetical protein